MNCHRTEGLLDALLDGDLAQADRAALEEHCHGCTACAEKLRSAQVLKQMLTETAPELDVSLTAQAAWRGAVRQEAQRGRRRGWVRWAGGIAAALVVAAGGFFALRGPRNPSMDAVEKSTVMAAGESVAVVEADGEAFESIDTAASLAMPMQARRAPMAERHMTVENLVRTCDYMADLAREYEGGLEAQRYESDGAQRADLYVDLPAENAGDFLAAAAHYDLSEAFDQALDAEPEDGRVSILLMLEEKT